MRSTVILRLALAVLGFFLGLGVALAARWRSPPDLYKPVCPDCRHTNPWFIRYDAPADQPGKVVGSAQYGTAVGTFDADPLSRVPRPVNGPVYHCPKCQAMWGPPAFHKKGQPRRRGW